jgi:hypothetical protein
MFTLMMAASLPHPLRDRELLKGKVLGKLKEKITEIEHSAKPER